MMVQKQLIFIQKSNPEILLLDLAMPKKDGLTVVKEVMAI